MCLIGSISWLGVAAIVAVGWVALGVGRRVLRWSWKGPLVLVAVAAVVAGHKLFDHESENHTRYVRLKLPERVQHDEDEPHGVTLAAAWDEDLGDRIRDTVKRNVERHLVKLE